MRTTAPRLTPWTRAHARAWVWGALALTLGLQAPTAQAESKVYRIGVLKTASHAALDADERGFEAALASAGFREGVNVVYDRHNAQGNASRAQVMARQLVAARIDLVHSIGTPATQAVVGSGGKIPLVFSSITDPVKAGIVPPGSAPGHKTGGHITGVSDQWPVFLQMQTYLKFVPQAKVWGTIYNPSEVNSVTHVQAMRQAAHQLGLQLVEVTIQHSQEVERAALALVGKVQAIVITSDNTTVANFEALVKVCEQHRTPVFAGDVDSVARGAVAAYGMDYFLVGYAAGKKAALVLKGVSPGNIPWGPVEKYSFVINRQAARQQGVTLPPRLLQKADKLLH